MHRLSPAQIRGARGMLGWSMTALAKASGLSVSTVKRAEGAESVPVSDEVFLLLRMALERQGVSFLPDNGDGNGIGLRWRRPVA